MRNALARVGRNAGAGVRGGAGPAGVGRGQGPISGNRALQRVARSTSGSRGG